MTCFCTITALWGPATALPLALVTGHEAPQLPCLKLICTLGTFLKL